MIRHKQFKQVPVAFLFSKDGGPTSLYLQVHDKLCSVWDPHYLDADQDFAFHLYADPDKNFHYNVDPDPASHFDADPDPVSQMMRIHADSDPQHCISE